IVARAVRERSVLPECRDRTHDNLRVKCPDRLVAESQPPDHPWCIILHDHIDLRYEVSDDLHRLGVLQVQAQTLLAQILLDVVRTPPIPNVRYPTRYIAIGSKLDLDYFGPHLGQVSRCGRSGQDLCEIKHPVALEHTLRCLCHVSPLSQRFNFSHPSVPNTTFSNRGCVRDRCIRKEWAPDIRTNTWPVLGS